MTRDLVLKLLEQFVVMCGSRASYNIFGYPTQRDPGQSSYTYLISLDKYKKGGLWCRWIGPSETSCRLNFPDAAIGTAYCGHWIDVDGTLQYVDTKDYATCRVYNNAQDQDGVLECYTSLGDPRLILASVGGSL